MQLKPSARTQPFGRPVGFHEQSKNARPEREEKALQAYVLIQTEANREPIAQMVRGIEGVLSAENLSGPFDAIALARSDSTRTLAEQVVAEIQRIPGVIRALSAPLIGSPAQTQGVGVESSVVAA
jgi:hypothetical protein